MSLAILLWVAALICFILDAVRVPSPRVALTPLGLALITLAALFGEVTFPFAHIVR